MEEIEELKQTKKPSKDDKPSREELRKKLRSKISQKGISRKGGITRKESQTLSDKIEKLMSLIKDENISLDTELSEGIMEKITEILSMNEIKKVLSQVNNNNEVSDNFKKFMNNVLESKPP